MQNRNLQPPTNQNIKPSNGFGTSGALVEGNQEGRSYPNTYGQLSKVQSYTQPSQDDLSIAPKNSIVSRLVVVPSANVIEIPVSGKSLFVQFTNLDEGVTQPYSASAVFIAFDDSPHFITFDPLGSVLGYTATLMIEGVSFSKVRMRAGSDTVVQIVAMQNGGRITRGIG